MNSTSPLSANLPGAASPGARGFDAGAGASGVSWSAIFAGAAGAAALSLILVLLGTGLGLSSVSPWSGQGASATTFGLSTILWLTFTQLAASGMGGYLAGRLRTKWAAVHTDEVYFRDTAHGFLAWAVATLVTAAMLASAIGSILGSGFQAGASMAGGVATAATTGAAAAGTAAMKDSSPSEGSGGMGYFVDSLFRKASATAPSDAASAPMTAGSAPEAGAATPSAAPMSAGTSTGAAGQSSMANTSAEVGRIFANDLRSGTLPAEDARYVGQLVAQQTGVSQADAEKRVNETFAKVQSTLKQAADTARDAADKARKASSYAALWLFVSMLIGAFVASLAATYGGRQRDL